MTDALKAAQGHVRAAWYALVHGRRLKVTMQSNFTIAVGIFRKLCISCNFQG